MARIFFKIFLHTHEVKFMLASLRLMFIGSRNNYIINRNLDLIITTCITSFSIALVWLI
jgi:hypothetical protein